MRAIERRRDMAMPSRPFDRRVEYLESVKGVATTWIDLGFACSENTDAVELDFMMLQYSTQDTLMTSTVSSKASSIFRMYISGARRYSHHRAAKDQWSPDTGINVEGNIGRRLSWRLDYVAKENRFFGVRTSTFNVTGEQTTEVNLCLGSPSEHSTPKIRYYGLRWFRNGALIHDYFPVRKDGIGYMYDRVADQLFGNQGSAAFILGPDVISGG